jgi:hypothetical protein
VSEGYGEGVPQEDNKRNRSAEAPPDNPQGPEGLKETVSWLRGRWGPMHAEIEDEICEDGKVIEHWSVRDDLAQAFQLGLIPAGPES